MEMLFISASLIFSNLWVICIVSIIGAFLLSNRMFPIIIYTVRTKNLMDEPEGRSAHSSKTPTLGGVGVFATFCIAILIYGMFSGLLRPDLIKLLALVGATTILLFLGIKDDLIAMSPKKKLVGQILSAALVVFATDIRVEGFYNIFGIGELPYIMSVLISMLIYVFVINAFNLIDGIDGLAGVIAILASSIFGLFFLVNGDKLMVVVTALLIGALLGFLKYNLSETKKLFLGDSGSMFVGFLLAFQAIYLVQMNYQIDSIFTIQNAPVFVISVLSYPVLDCLRVFVVRIKQKRSPFSADRNHIHHRILDLGLTHQQTTTSISVTNAFVVLFIFLVGNIYINLQLYLLVVIVPSFYFILFCSVKNLIKPVSEIQIKNHRKIEEGIQMKDFVLTSQPITTSFVPVVSNKSTKPSKLLSKPNDLEKHEELEYEQIK